MDLALCYSPAIDGYDLAIDATAADLQGDDTLGSVVLASLMADRLAQPGEVYADADRRGWWADAFGAVGDLFGSRLWLLARAKVLPDTLQRARGYIEESLAWLVDDGFATSVTATVFTPRRGWVVAEVAVLLNGSSRRFRFEWNDETQVWRVAGERA